MPTYDYECRDCEHRFELVQNMSDPTIETCPKCGGHLERLIGGGVGIIVKGANRSRAVTGECGGGACSVDPSEGTCCAGEGSCESPPCMI